MAAWFDINYSQDGGPWIFLERVADPDPADLTYNHTPTTPGSIYSYRARRYDDVTGLYSAWSTIAVVRAPYPPGVTPVVCAADDVATGSDTELHFALEACQGIPAKAVIRLGYTGGIIEHEQESRFSEELDGTPDVRKDKRNGPITFTGQFTMHLSGDTLARFLPLIGQITSSTAITGGWRHRFNLAAKKLVAGTLHHRIKKEWRVYTGVVLSSFEFSYEQLQQGLIICTFAGMALDRLTWNVERGADPSVLGVLTSPGDGLLKYAPSDTKTVIAGKSCWASSSALTVARTLKPRAVLCNALGAKSHYIDSVDIRGSASGNYENDFFQLKDLGITGAPSEYGVGDTLATNEVIYTWTPPVEANGFTYRVKWVMPEADIKSSTPIGGPDEIVEQLEFLSNKSINNVAGTSGYVEIDTPLSAATLTTPGPSVVTVPASKTRTYNYGVVNATGTTTTCASLSGHVSAVNDYYVGDYIKFETGALAGLKAQITDYAVAGATKTFTFTPAFPSAPAANDVFEII